MDEVNCSSSYLYGKGVFTTIAIRHDGLVLWEKHWKRLVSDSATVGLDVSELTEGTVRTALEDEIQKKLVVTGRARITLVDERASDLWPCNDLNQIASIATALSVLAAQRQPLPRPFKITVSPFPVNSRSPLAGVKSCNYLEQTLAKDEAKGRGFHEAVRVNERGHVTGGCMANVFWAVGKRLFTSALSTGCLAGTTREYVIENMECDEVEAEIGEVETADAIFLTSAGLGVVAVDEFDGRTLEGEDHPIVQLWRELETK